MQDVAQIVMGLGIVGLERDGLAKRGLRLDQLSLSQQGVAQVVMGTEIIGLEGDGLAERRLRLGQLPQI
jgi:hypothetical protein